MTGLRKYPPTIDAPEWSDLIDFLGGNTTESQINTLKILLADADGFPLSSWQAAGDKQKIDANKIYGIIPTGNISPLTGDLDFTQHKALNVLIDVLTSDPTTPLAGQIWYRSDLEKLSLRRASVTDRVVLEDLVQTLTNKTLTTPTIGNFANAGHNHQAAAGGGQLDHGAALAGLTDDDHTQYVLRSIMTTRGDLFYRNATVVTRLGLGSAGKVPRSDGTDLAYSTFTIPNTFALGDLVYASSANILAALAINETTTRKFLRAVSSGLAWDTLVAGDIPQLDHGGLAGLADDDHTQYLNTTRHDVVGRHPVTVGGTGLATIAAGGILYASALNTLSRIASTAANQVLRSTGADALEFAALVAADIPSLDASKTTTGRFGLARLPDAAINKFIRSQGVGSDAIYDTLVAADIPSLDAAKITTGRFTAARLLDGTSGYFLKAQGAGVDPLYALLVAADIPNLDTAKLTTGLLAIARGGLNNATWTALQLIRMNAGGTAFESSGKTIADFAAASHTHAATDITSETLDGDRLPAITTTKKGAVPATGTPTGRFLKDDGTFASIPGGGDMLQSTYDVDADGIVDKAESVDDGLNSATAAEIATAVHDRWPDVFMMMGG